MVGVGFLTHALVAKSLEAGRTIRQNILRLHGITRTVQITATATLTRVPNAITHTRLLALCLTERNTLAIPALALLNAVGVIRHVVGLGTVSRGARARGVLLAGGVVGTAALAVGSHVLAVVAARGVLVAADAALT